MINNFLTNCPFELTFQNDTTPCKSGSILSVRQFIYDFINGGIGSFDFIIGFCIAIIYPQTNLVGPIIDFTEVSIISIELGGKNR